MGGKAMLRGASIAHNTCKVPVEPENETGLDEHGETTGCLSCFVQTEAVSWEKLRQDDCDENEHAQAMELLHRYLAANKQELPPITGRDVWQVSRSFPTMTVAPDGWHPRTFSLLGETGRELLARQLMIWEAAGMWPHSNSTIHMSSQRKPAGGRRLIGWYRAAFRLWSAIRGEHWRDWETKHATEGFFGQQTETVC